MSKIAKLVKNAFGNYPIIANSVAYGILFVGAEASQQTVTKKLLATEPLPYDKPILGRYMFYGTLVQGPILATWYRWLDRNFIGRTTPMVIRKVVLDQFMLTPSILVLFYVAMSIMENKQDLLAECKQKIIPTFKTSCMFWLPAQALNFLLVPPVFRVIYVGCCSFAWVNILCWIKRQEY